MKLVVHASGTQALHQLALITSLPFCTHHLSLLPIGCKTLRGLSNPGVLHFGVANKKTVSRKVGECEHFVNQERTGKNHVGYRG